MTKTKTNIKIKKEISKNYKSEIKYIAPSEIQMYEQNARTHSDKQIQQIANSIEVYGFTNPILIDQNKYILAGVGRLRASLLLKLKEVPVVTLSHLTDIQRKAYILADNKIAEKAGWDYNVLKLEFEEIIEFDNEFDLTLTGFETPEIDFIIHNDTEENSEDEEQAEDLEIEKRVNFGDVWKLGKHILICGDSLKENAFKELFNDNKTASMTFIDPPYNVPISGHVCNKGKTKHSEFAMASGEMNSSEFHSFLQTSLSHATNFSKDGSLHYICMDWRHVQDLLNSTSDIYHELKNICVWNKQSAGMGSLYRSQHELIFLFKKGSKSHTNNVELGKHGRYRTNVWDYPGVHATSHRRTDLKFHPTVKPVSMISDAILDCTKPNEIILDCFAGSGSTLLAAENTNRIARIIEYEPKYCDVILHRFESKTGIKPKLIKGANK